MIKIERITEEELEKGKRFLLTVPSINTVDMDILKKAILVYDDENIVGAISYEMFNEIGLIRYFVFKKQLDESIIVDLFSTLEQYASHDGIKKLFCIVNENEIQKLFSSLGFNITDTENIYIDEDPYNKQDYASSSVMIKEIEVA